MILGPSDQKIGAIIFLPISQGFDKRSTRILVIKSPTIVLLLMVSSLSSVAVIVFFSF